MMRPGLARTSVSTISSPRVYIKRMQPGESFGSKGWLARGRRFDRDISQGLYNLFGVEVSADGLAGLFQPSFPGVRCFVVQPRLAPDRAVELTLVGIARDGRPIWQGQRALVLGRDGSLELHRGLDQIHPAYQHRNITGDLINRELNLLRIARRGPTSRITIDAEGIGRYQCAINGFIFADETNEGPPLRSNRPFAPEQDRARVINAAEQFLEEVGRSTDKGRLAIEGAQEEARKTYAPWSLARLHFAGEKPESVGGYEGKVGITKLGREFWLARDTPSWRAALYLEPIHPAIRTAGEQFRAAREAYTLSRLDHEIDEARTGLASDQRAARILALETLGMIGSDTHASLVKPFTQSLDRRIAGVARQVLITLSGTELPLRMRNFVFNIKEDAQWRGLVLRILAEHYPEEITEQSSLLRVDPDARIQRGVIPVVARAAQGTAELAAMLAANPSSELRPGLAELRLELIELLGKRIDPLTLPVLLEQYRGAGNDPAETLALSRAVVGFRDPRANAVLSDIVRNQHRPPLP